MGDIELEDIDNVDEDYDEDYNSRIYAPDEQETTFTTPGIDTPVSSKTSIYRNESKNKTIKELYHHLELTGNTTHARTDLFRVRLNQKHWSHILEF